MPVSPQDYALWAAATGNAYPKTAQEKARLAPEVYDFNRGFGKFRGFDEVQGFQGDIVYDQPQSIRHYGDNSLLQSPITPDNNVPKVAGQLNNTLTGQHYTKHYADDASETGFGGMEQPRSLLEKAAIGALGAGALAAGAYGLQKATGRDLGVGKVGGMVRDLGRKAKSGLKSALGLADEAAGPQFVSRQAVDETLGAAQHGISAIDDVAPGIVREQNVIPVDIRATQQAKSRIPDPWGESALGQAGQTMSAPAMQSVVPSQSSAAGIDPDIAERVANFTRNTSTSLFGTQQGVPYSKQTFVGPTGLTPVPSRTDETAFSLLGSSQEPRRTVVSGIDPQTKQPYSKTVLRSELMSTKAEQLLDPNNRNAFIGYRTAPITSVPGSVSALSEVSTVPQRPTLIGSFPGAEGSSSSGVQFTPAGAMAGSRPYRYTVLPAESRAGKTITEFVQRPVEINGRWVTQYDPVSVFQDPIENEGVDILNRLKGLSAPQYPLPAGAVIGEQRVFSTDPRAATAQKQAEAIYQATGDPSFIRGAYSETPSLPIRAILPSGETVPTGSLFEPFDVVRQPVVDKYTGVKTFTGLPVTEAREQSLQAALNRYSQVKARALEQRGLPATYQPSQAELQRLGPFEKGELRRAASEVERAINRLEDAKASQLRYKLRPEITEGVREVPVFGEVDPEGIGEIIGSKIVAESSEAIPTSKYYRMRAGGSAGRQEAGGIGRRREAIENLEGLTFGVGTGSLEDVTPVLYKGIDDVTGQATVFRPEDVNLVQIATGAVTPVRGTAVEPQRIMGREGRTFKGVAANVIDPASFDPAMLSQIAEATPERIDPSSGLAYSQQAMGGERAAQRRRQIEAMRQSGQRVRGRMGTELPASIVRGGAISESGVDPALGTRFARRGRAPEGSARAQQIELMRQRDELVKQVLSGEVTLPVTRSTEIVPRQTTPPGIIRGKASPVQRAFSRFAQFVGNPYEL